jgi:hypothetical protein
LQGTRLAAGQGEIVSSRAGLATQLLPTIIGQAGCENLFAIEQSNERHGDKCSVPYRTLPMRVVLLGT